MPKQIPLTIKKEWLQEYEDGKTEAQIAREQRHSLRVIKRGVEEARADRSGAAARAEIVKDALKNHQKQLLSVVERLVRLAEPPPANLELRRDRDGFLVPTPLPHSLILHVPLRGLTVELSDEKTPQWGLLKEHLKRSRIWPLLEQWRKSLIVHMNARLDFESAIKGLIESETGLRVSAVTYGDKKAITVYPAALNLFYEVSMRKALGILDGTNLEENMIAVPDGHVSLGSALAYCPGKQNDCRDALIRAFQKIKGLPDRAKVITTEMELENACRRLRESAEDIQLMGLVPGRCRICNRISL